MLEVRERIASSPAEVWRWVSDLRRWGELLPTVDEIVDLRTLPTTGVGSQFRILQPGLAKAIYTITQWRDGVGFTWEARLPGLCTIATHAVAAADIGAELTLGIRWEGLLAPVVTRLYSRRAQSLIEVEAATFARLATHQE